jgi:hypothetical protein
VRVASRVRAVDPSRERAGAGGGIRCDEQSGGKPGIRQVKKKGPGAPPPSLCYHTTKPIPASRAKRLTCHCRKRVIRFSMVIPFSRVYLTPHLAARVFACVDIHIRLAGANRPHQFIELAGGYALSRGSDDISRG